MDEVVDAVIFLLSDKSSMINGVTLPIDGGFLGCWTSQPATISKLQLYIAELSRAEKNLFLIGYDVNRVLLWTKINGKLIWDYKQKRKVFSSYFQI